MIDHLRIIWLAAIAASLFTASPACAQFVPQASGPGPQYGEKLTTYKLQIGVKVKASGGPCRGIRCTMPVPLDCPGQEVRVFADDSTAEVKEVKYRNTTDSLRQALVEIPSIAADKQAYVLITFEVTRRAVSRPEDTSIYTIPKRLPRELIPYVGDSPYIETRHTKTKSLGRDLTREGENDWQRVEQIFNYVRDNIEYREGALVGSGRTLRNGFGNSEDINGLFIAICRARKIPARLVWIHGHQSAEFYLLDDEGNGHWFPCQLAGVQAFGESSEDRPIMQKGESIRVPEKPKERQRFVSEYLKGVPVPGGGRPRVEFVRQAVN